MIDCRPTVGVFGHTGWLGGQLTIGLEARGLPVRRLTWDSSASDASWARQLGDVDVVVNAIGKSVGERHDLEHVNAVLPGWIVDRLPLGVRAFVHLGSASEYGYVGDGLVRETDVCRPVSRYGVTKLKGTIRVLKAASQRGIRAYVLRPFTLTGASPPSHTLAGKLMEELMNAGPRGHILLKSGRSERDFTPCSLVVDAVAALIDQGPAQQVLNVCTGDRHMVWDFARALLESSGLDQVRILDEENIDKVPVCVGNPARLRALCTSLNHADLLGQASVCLGHP